MVASKKLLVVGGTSLVLGVSSAAMAQAPAAKSSGKSSQVTTIGEGEALMIGPKGQNPQVQHQGQYGQAPVGRDRRCKGNPPRHCHL